MEPVVKKSSPNEALFNLEAVNLDSHSHMILSDINLNLQPLQMYLIAGPSGGGKTSLLRLLNGLVFPTSGTIHYAGRPITGYDMPRLRSEVVMMAQEPVLFEGTVRDNVYFPFSFASNSAKKPDEEMLLQLVSTLGLSTTLFKRPINLLSGGEKQRVALARALLPKPKVLLADEPTSALDPLSEEKVIDMFIRLKGEISLVVVSHSTRFLDFADEIILISNGRIIDRRKTIDTDHFRKFLQEEDKGEANG